VYDTNKTFLCLLSLSRDTDFSWVGKKEATTWTYSSYCCYKVFNSLFIHHCWQALSLEHRNCHLRLEQWEM